MRSPTTVWAFISFHSSSVSGPGLLRIASGIATLPMSCSSAAALIRSTSSSSRPSPWATFSTIASTDSECSPV